MEVNSAGVKPLMSARKLQHDQVLLQAQALHQVLLQALRPALGQAFLRVLHQVPVQVLRLGLRPVLGPVHLQVYPEVIHPVTALVLVPVPHQAAVPAMHPVRFLLAPRKTPVLMSARKLQPPPPSLLRPHPPSLLRPHPVSSRSPARCVETSLSRLEPRSLSMVFSPRSIAGTCVSLPALPSLGIIRLMGVRKSSRTPLFSERSRNWKVAPSPNLP
jgi:hypothetical protein